MSLLAIVCHFSWSCTAIPACAPDIQLMKSVTSVAEATQQSSHSHKCTNRMLPWLQMAASDCCHSDIARPKSECKTYLYRSAGNPALNNIAVLLKRWLIQWWMKGLVIFNGGVWWWAHSKMKYLSVFKLPFVEYKLYACIETCRFVKAVFFHFLKAVSTYISNLFGKLRDKPWVLNQVDVLITSVKVVMFVLLYVCVLVGLLLG